MAIVAMLTGLIIMVGVVFGSANTAYAATLTPADERYHVAFPYNDMEYYVGVAGLDASGNKYYCIEAGKLSDYVIGPTTVLASDENARRMAWILDRYRDTDAATHAAIGIIVQDHFGRDRDEWARQMAVIQGRYPEIVAKAARIWDQSAGKTPAGTTVERTDAEALRSGSISVKVVTAPVTRSRECRSPSPCRGRRGSSKAATRSRGCRRAPGPRSRGRRPAPAR